MIEERRHVTISISLNSKEQCTYNYKSKCNKTNKLANDLNLSMEVTMVVHTTLKKVAKPVVTKVQAVAMKKARTTARPKPKKERDKLNSSRREKRKIISSGIKEIWLRW